MSKIQRLDGFTADGFGNVIDGEPRDGDVVRIDDNIEKQYHMPVDPGPPPAKSSGMSYDEFRALFTVAELTTLDSCTDDEYMQAISLTPLTVLQKATVRFLISEAKATGAGLGINLASPKLTGIANPPTPGALDVLASYGLLASSRKPEVLSGKKQS